MEQGSNPSSVDLPPEMTLHEAAKNGDTSAIQLLIKNGASVNATDKDLMTPLHEAAFEGHTEAIQQLIMNGASVNATNKDESSPLYLAALIGHPEAVDILISHGADPFATDVAGQMLLHIAGFNALPALMNHMCGFCKCSQQHGVNPFQINAADPWGRTPLQLQSHLITAFAKFREHRAEAPVPCVNVLDCDGSEEVECVSGQRIKAVLPLRWDLSSLKVEENEEHKLTRIQTHVLRHLLSQYSSYNDDLPPTVDKWLHFVFDSVIRKEVGAICTFPCNHAQDPQEMEDILSKKGDPEGLCHRLMDSSMGRCDMESEESMSMTAEVESFLTDLSSYFQQQCPLLQFQWKRVGSSAEDTKTGCPDEFDALLHFTELSKYVTVKGVKIKWIGMDANVEQEMVQWSPRKDLISFGVKVKIFQLMMDFLAEKKSWGKLTFRFLKQFYCGFSAVLHLSNLYNIFNIKVDLVPLFSHEQRWYVFDDVAYSKIHKVDNVSESFALMELDHMRSLPPNAREGYTMAKSLRDVHLLSHMMNKPILLDLVDRVLPSHALKHAMFHAFEQEKGSLKPHEWAQRIYAQMTSEKLINFFSPRRELFSQSYYSYPRQEHMNLFIRRRRPDLQAFPTMMEVMEYRKIFIHEILKILE